MSPVWPSAPRVLCSWASSCTSERGDKAGAEAAYRAAIAADPQHANAHISLGAVLGGCGDHAGAARLFAAALKIDPSHAGAKANLQQALRMLKDERFDFLKDERER